MFSALPPKTHIFYAICFFYVLQKKSRNKLWKGTCAFYFWFNMFFYQVDNKRFIFIFYQLIPCGLQITSLARTRVHGKHTTRKAYCHHVTQMQTYRLQMEFHHCQQPCYIRSLPQFASAHVH